MLVTKPNLKEFEEYSNNELVKTEKELYGFYLSDHPVTKYNNSVIKIVFSNREDYYFSEEKGI